jgi:hypothetical protein
MPLFEGESLFEGPSVPLHVVRRTAYWSYLSGAIGTTYGWDNENTANALPFDLPGYHQMRYVRMLLEGRPWWRLALDQAHGWIVAGYGEYNGGTGPGGDDYVTAAYDPDGGLLLAYLPHAARGMRRITVDLRCFSGHVHARWFDPTNGSFLPVTASPLPNAGLQQFTSPTANSAGDDDWVLVLEAASAAEHVAHAPEN